MKLHIDFETASELDLPTVGAYRYAEHPSTFVRCMAWAINAETPEIWTPEMRMPDKLKNALQHAEVHAWNAQFERLMFEHRMHIYPAPTWRQWHCTAAQARANALPGELKKAAAALQLDERKQNTRIMKKLADASCIPTEEERQALHEYCRQDVVVEREIHYSIPELSDDEQFMYELNERINDNGIGVDVVTVEKIIAWLLIEQAKLNTELCELTKGAVTAFTQVQRIKDFLPFHVTSLDAAAVEQQLSRGVEDATARRILEIRQQAGKSSVAKYTRMLEQLSEGNKLRGQFVYAGAGQTGRFSGKGVQLHNLPRQVPDNVDQLIEDINAMEKPRAFKLMHGTDFIGTASQLIRPMLVAGENKKFIIGDFSAVEARGLPYLAECDREVEAWRAGTDRYIEDAANVFGIAEEAVTSGQRQAGKVVRLACGFGGKTNALLAMAKGYGLDLSRAEAERMANAWHFANPWAISFGKMLEKAALLAVNNPEQVVPAGKHLKYASQFSGPTQILRCLLPSGRVISYHDAQIEEGRFGPCISTLKPRTGQREWLWHGLYAENVTQAFCNDLMRHAMALIHTEGYRIVAHVHDETVEEVEAATAAEDCDKIRALMQTTPPWAEDFPLVAKVHIAERYTK